MQLSYAKMENILSKLTNSPADNCHQTQFTAVRTGHRLTLQWQLVAAADDDNTNLLHTQDKLPSLYSWQFHLSLHSFCHLWDTINLQIISPLSPADSAHV